MKNGVKTQNSAKPEILVKVRVRDRVRIRVRVRVMKKGEKSENRTKFEILVKSQNYLKNKILRYPKNSFHHSLKRLQMYFMNKGLKVAKQCKT